MRTLHGYVTPNCITDYEEPSTVDVYEVIGNIDRQYDRVVNGIESWTEDTSWPNVTVKALADEIRRLHCVLTEKQREIDDVHTEIGKRVLRGEWSWEG